MENRAICPECGANLPIFTDDGNHNFVPHIKDGKFINICIKCKVDEVTATWNHQAWSVDLPICKGVCACS